VTDTELFMRKVAASVVPAVSLVWLSFIVYAVVVNGVGWHIMRRIWFPTPAPFHIQRYWQGCERIWIVGAGATGYPCNPSPQFIYHAFLADEVGVVSLRTSMKKSL
jgi:hypothetical protein